MITQLTGLPEHIVGFRATGSVTKEDYDTVVLPAVQSLVNKYDELNYIMIIDTPLDHFSAGAWVKDALLGLKHLTKWNRSAILTDSTRLNEFTDFASKLIPGEFRGFLTTELDAAVAWIESPVTA